MFEKKNIRVQYLRTLEKIRNFLLSKKSREFLIFLFFAFVSFCFWLLQVLNDDYETELTISLRMKNVPENVVLTSELPSDLKVGVKDRGTVLFNYIVGQTFYPLTIDFEEYIEKGSQVRILSSSLSKRIASQLNQSTKIQTIKPDTLEYIYTKGVGKKLPVKFRGEVKAQRQYYIADTIFSPDSVMAFAPREILDTMTAAYTELLEKEEVSDTLRQQLRLMPVRGARFTPSQSDVTFLVDVFAEKTVEVPVQGINFPDDKLLRTFPSKVNVTFQIGLSQFKSITAEDFTVVVDYLQIQESKNDKCRPALLRSPENVNHVRVSPQAIDYIIEQKVTFND